MKILVDMNLSPKWVAFLETSGIEATHWSHVGPATASDEELMMWAAEHDHAVLTADLDFTAILATTQRNKPSVILLRAELLTSRSAGEQVVSAIRTAQRDLAEGAIISVDGLRNRMRILPLAN